jgi:hypothetical protein
LGLDKEKDVNNEFGKDFKMICGGDKIGKEQAIR